MSQVVKQNDLFMCPTSVFNEHQMSPELLSPSVTSFFGFDVDSCRHSIAGVAEITQFLPAHFAT